MTTRILIILFSICLFSACKQSTQNQNTSSPNEQNSDSGLSGSVTDLETKRTIVRTEVPKVTIEEAIKLASEGYQFVDCRTPSEIADGKIENAIEMDVKTHDFYQKTIKNWTLDKKLILYCKSGTRSALAGKLLAEMQFTNAVDMTGGYDEWIKYHNNK